MDTQILKQILDIGFYTDNKDKLTKKLFDGDTLELYDTIVNSHNKHGADLTTEELFELWKIEHPAATTANIQVIADLVGKINSQDKMNPEVASTVLDALWKRSIGTRLSKLGIAMAEGREGAYEDIIKLVEKTSTGFLPTNFPDRTTTDLDKLLEQLSDENRFRFNIPVLAKQVYGIGRGEFGIIFARPNTGKTALGISLCVAPGGYIDQGHRVAILGNEEVSERTMLRAYSSYTGMTKEEIIVAPRLAKERFEKVTDRVIMQNIMNWPITEVESYLKSESIDVAVVDQLDKVGVNGEFTGDHLRLREVYTQAREIPKRLNLALWGMSQASVEAENKTVLLPSMMEGSKTGKFAEADIILGVGKFADEADGSENFVRFITSGKNKINGWHGTITCKLERMIHRYVD